MYAFGFKYPNWKILWKSGIQSNITWWTTLRDLATRNISTKFQHTLHNGSGEEVENGKNMQKFLKKLKKIAGPRAEEIKI